jgi:hypothetical protein
MKYVGFDWSISFPKKVVGVPTTIGVGRQALTDASADSDASTRMS